MDRDLVRQLVRREFGVALPAVGRLLHTLGLSAQRPLRRAYEQDPEAVRRWKSEAYPALRAQAQDAGATAYLADEAGVGSDYHAGATWPPAGRTPVVAGTGKRLSINMISAVTASGALRFAVYRGTTNAASFIDFCRRPVHGTSGPVYLVVGGPPGTATSQVRRLHPGPARGCSSCPATRPSSTRTRGGVKHDRVGRGSVTSQDELTPKAIGALRRPQKLPHLARRFFADPSPRYITA